MTNVRTIHVDWYSQRPPRFSGGPQLAYQGDHLSNMVVFDNAPELPNYYLLVEMKTDDAGPVVALPEILLEGPYWVIPNYYTQICQKITYQVCCKTESGDFEQHSAKFEGTILPVIKHNGEPIDQSPMFDPYIDILDKRVDELIVAAGDIQIDSELKSDSGNPVQNRVIKTAIDEIGNDVDAVNGRLQQVEDAIGVDVTPDISFTDGSAVKFANGQLTANANRSYSDFVPIYGAERIVISMLENVSATIYGVAFYTNNTQEGYITDSGVREEYGKAQAGYSVRTIPVPSGANFFRTTWCDSTSEFYDNFECKLLKDGTLVDRIDADIADVNSRVDEVSEKFVKIEKETVESTRINGKWVAYIGSGANHGAVRDGEYYSYAVANVTPGQKYYITTKINGYLGVCFYNGAPSHETIVGGFNSSTSGETLTDYEVVCPANANTLAVSANATTVPIIIKKAVEVEIDLNDISDKVSGLPKIYTVGQGKEYQSFCACLFALAGDTSEKEIHIFGGTYDVLEELGGLDYINNLPSDRHWRTVNAIIPPNTTVIGHGNVIIKMELPTTVDNSTATLFAPINIQGSCKLKNLTITSKNCRYCIHAEGSTLSEFDNAVWSWEDLYVEKTEAVVGTLNAIGMGLNNGQFLEIKNCVVKCTVGPAIGCHDNGAQFAKSPVLSFANTAFIGSSENATCVSFRSTFRNNMQTVIKALFANCHITGKVQKTTANGGEIAKDVYAVTYIRTPHETVPTSYVTDIIPDAVYD